MKAFTKISYKNATTKFLEYGIPSLGVIGFFFLYHVLNSVVHEQQKLFDDFSEDKIDKSSILHSISTDYQSTHISTLAALLKALHDKNLTEIDIKSRITAIDNTIKNLKSFEEYYPLSKREERIYLQILSSLHYYQLQANGMLSSHISITPASMSTLNENYARVSQFLKLFDSTTSQQMVMSYDRVQSLFGQRLQKLFTIILVSMGFLSLITLTFYSLIKKIKSSLKQLDQEKAFSDSIIHSVEDMLIVTNANLDIIKTNPTANQLINKIPRSCHNLLDILSGVSREDIFSLITHQKLELEAYLQFSKPDEHRYLSLSGSKIKKDNQKLSNDKSLEFVFVAKDISYRKKVENQLNYQATHDNLTDLSNRGHFIDQLNQFIESPLTNDPRHAVIFIDLDRFKIVNDTYGHDIGDELLKYVSNELQNVVTTEDVVCRFGGDEFLIFIKNAQKSRSIKLICQKILVALSQPIDIQQKELYSGASIGVSIYPDDAVNAKDLILKADTAMYRSKKEGKNRFSFYTTELGKTVNRRLELVADLHHAIENKELQIYYQPQVNTKTNQMIGAEALLRWEHHLYGFINPEEMIQIAEESDMIFMIGEWLIHEVCRHLSDVIRSGHCPVRIAINISEKQFHNDSIISQIQQAFHEYNTPSELIIIEITENTLSSKTEYGLSLIRQLNELGIKVSIDDFGTGYSSLSFIKQFPIDHLKIDKSFIDDIEDNKSDEAILNAIIALAKELNVDVIAEGVETSQQLECLNEHGCFFVQGYLYSRPINKEKFMNLIQATTVSKKFIDNP